MEPSASPGTGKATIWTGRIISVLLVLMLGMSGVMKFTGSEELTEGMSHLGWPVKVAIALGITELACTLLYAIPQTSVLGAILLTGYLGGAIATHARIGEQFVFQAILGVLVWLGLYFRDRRLQELLPWRKSFEP